VQVLLTLGGRLKVAALGVPDALSSMEEAAAEGADPTGQRAQRAQRADLSSVGALALTLAAAGGHGPHALDALSARYSREACRVVAGLLASADGEHCGWRQAGGEGRVWWGWVGGWGGGRPPDSRPAAVPGVGGFQWLLLLLLAARQLSDAAPPPTHPHPTPSSGTGGGFPDWRALAAALGPLCLLGEADASSARADALLGQLQREADNGRLLRVLGQLCAVVDRPELRGDASWAETGDR
jgi:hypothetical protein